MSEKPKIAKCETCPAYSHGQCFRTSCMDHVSCSDYCMQHPDNRHLMEPPAKCEESKQGFSISQYDAFYSQYAAMTAERDALKAEIVACRKSMENILVAARIVVDYYDGPSQ